MFIEIDGARQQQLTLADGQTNCTFDLVEMERGFYRIRAVLKTSDGRMTRSNELLLLVGHTQEPFSLWVGALIVLLILSLGMGLLWFNEPLFGSKPLQWLTSVRDILSMLLPLVIGVLFLYLGFRERAVGRDERSESGQAIWPEKSLIRRQLTNETIPNGIPRVRRWLDEGNLWVALTLVGVVPISFLGARLAGWAEAPELVSVVVFLLLGVVIFLAIGSSGRRNPKAALRPIAQLTRGAASSGDSAAGEDPDSHMARKGSEGAVVEADIVEAMKKA